MSRVSHKHKLLKGYQSVKAQAALYLKRNADKCKGFKLLKRFKNEMLNVKQYIKHAKTGSYTSGFTLDKSFLLTAFNLRCGVQAAHEKLNRNNVSGAFARQVAPLSNLTLTSEV